MHITSILRLEEGGGGDVFCPLHFFAMPPLQPATPEGSPLLGLGLPFSLSSCQGAGFMGLVVPSFFPMAGGGGSCLPVVPCCWMDTLIHPACMYESSYSRTS